jgi:hypothetical protein
MTGQFSLKRKLPIAGFEVFCSGGKPVGSAAIRAAAGPALARPLAALSAVARHPNQGMGRPGRSCASLGHRAAWARRPFPPGPGVPPGRRVGSPGVPAARGPRGPGCRRWRPWPGGRAAQSRGPPELRKIVQRYCGLLRPCAPLAVGAACSLSLAIGVQVLTFRSRALIGLRAAYMPDAARSVSCHPPS